MAPVTPDPRPVAVVTGAGRGLGRAVSVRLAEHGWNLVLIARTESELNDTATSVRRSGGDAVVIVADLCDRDVPAQVMSAALEQFGQVDGVVCNAAIYRTTPAIETSDDEWFEVLDTNVGATFRLLRAAGRHLIDSERGGSIVIVGSAFGLVGVSNTAAYAASKGALVALTRTLAIEWARHGIRVNMVAPGHIQTDIAIGTAPDGSESFLRNIPMRRIARPDEIAAQIVHVLGPDSSFMTGAVNVVDGGFTVR